ncbi:hypothetical protein [Kitasatospora sp. NPDC018619]|uniref:hypothetical protein n=1 Tax=unclassified Kitasatospora TaxID=2633591 RepID=UPI0037ACE040
MRTREDGAADEETSGRRRFPSLRIDCPRRGVRRRLPARQQLLLPAGAAPVAPDGRIVARYGGPGDQEQGFNSANTTAVPVGSAFTPVVFAAGPGRGCSAGGGGWTPVTPATPYDGDKGGT